MVKRVFGAMCWIATLLAVWGCDPKQLVKKKVPEPVQEILGPPGTVAKKAKKKKKPHQKKVFEITSPRNKAVLPDIRPVRFEVDVHFPGENPLPDHAIQWLSWDKIKNRVGFQTTGRAFEHKFSVGHWAVQCKIEPPGKKTQKKWVEFFIKPGSRGQVVYNGAGLGGVEIVSIDLQEGKELGKVTTDKDGSFVALMPEKGYCKLQPGKAGFAFAPPYRIAKHGEPFSKFQFDAARGQIKDIRLTAGPEEQDAVSAVCPGNQAYVRASIKPEAGLERIAAQLVSPGIAARSPFGLGEVLQPPQGAPSKDGFIHMGLPVRIPMDAIPKSENERYALRLTARDERGNAFSSEVPGSVSVDMAECLSKSFSEAESLQEQGKIEQAVDIYNEIERLREAMPRVSAAAVMEKVFFNRGLAYLEMAAGLPAGDLKRLGYLAKAENDFEEVLQFHMKDEEALLLSGLVKHLKKDYDAALDAYGKSLALNPSKADIYELRAKAFLGTGLKKNLSQAVDDFTSALELQPDRTELRKARSESLRLDLDHLEDPSHAQVDTSSVTGAKSVLKDLKLRAYRRD